MIDPIHWTCSSCKERNWIHLSKPVEMKEEHAAICRFCQHVSVVVIGANWPDRQISRSAIRKAAEDLLG